MKTGLLFGSFNPVHVGHLIIANSVIGLVDKTWFVISPQNPFKAESILIDVKERLELLRSAVKDNQQFSVCDVELSFPVPSYTINTLKALEDKFPENQFYLIMGSDNYKALNSWKDFESIQQYPILIYERPEFPVDEKALPSHIKKLKTPLLNISATSIRERIQKKQSIRYLVPDNVIEVIQKKKLYQK